MHLNQITPLKNSAGLVSISFRSYSPLEILTEMKKCSLSLIEWGSDVHAPCIDEKRLYEIAHLQREYGISCCSYGTYFKLGVTDICELEQYINAAKILGTDVLRLWCGDRDSERYTERERTALFETASAAAEIAERYGVTLCMECHNNTYTQTIDGALEIMQAVNSEHFQMYWQPNQLLTFEDNIKYASEISLYVKNVHVFNWEGGEKHPLSQAVPVWKKYLACFEGQKNFLLEFMPDDRIESLKAESAALFEILKD